MADETDRKGFVFPCDFTIKVFGNASDQLAPIVLQLIQKHIPGLTRDAIQTRTSENGKYFALTIHLVAESREQLDAIYRDLSASPDVLMAL